MNKVVASPDEAIKDIFDGATIMMGGFGLCGIPENLVRALVRKGVKNLTTISNNAGVDGLGKGLLLAAGQISKHIGTYVGENKLLEQMVLQRKLISTWYRREPFPSAFAPAELASPHFSHRQESAQSLQRTRKRASSTAANT